MDISNRRSSGNATQIGVFSTMGLNPEFQEMLSTHVGLAPQEYRDLQIAIAMPLAFNRSQTKPLTIFVQNPYDVRIRYSVDVKLFPEAMSSLHVPDVQACRRVDHKLNPGESGVLEIPMWVKAAAKVGAHAHDISLITANDEAGLFGGRRGSRVYAQAPRTEVKRQDDFVSKNLVGLGLVGVVGLGFVSLPTGGAFFRLAYMVMAHDAGEMKPTDLTARFRRLWGPRGASAFLPESRGGVKAR